MVSYVISSIVGGLIFGILDAIINANPFGSKLMQFYKPLARQKINAPAGLVIDLIYGFIISAVFLLICSILPTGSGFLKGVIYGLIMWFFRVVMGVLSNHIMLNVPLKTSIYILLTGLVEMIILGVINGLILSNKCHPVV
ncbi:MAG TPA: hypothetical protein VHI78_01470 [Bacteroidales bacterium]|jgi:hypothetical protein|nr:hypothetical protein [Bacteroidales bacterium]